MGTLFVDNIKHESAQGSGTITLGASGETVQAASGVTNNIGIGMLDQWMIPTSQSISADTVTTVNSSWTRQSLQFDNIGLGLTESSGIFSFPVTGTFFLTFISQVSDATDMRYIQWENFASTDSGSSYDLLTKVYTHIKTTTTTTFSNITGSCAFKVTDTSTFRLKFAVAADEAFDLAGNATSMRTGFQVMRVGDT
tara:strand:- start:83 stop:670 length:588 start_codon:yes stop_codon:yes gene_type:complete